MGNVDKTLKAVARYRSAGLLRCCIETIHRHNAPGRTEGERLTCPTCKTSIAWKGGAWEWPRSAEPLASFLADRRESA